MSAPTDFFRYILQRGLAMIDSVGLRLSIPPGATVSVDYAPATAGEVWLVYYMSFGDIPSDTFTLTVRFMQSKYGGRAYYQVFSPLGYDAINVGLVLWCPTVKGNPLELKITNLDTATQVFSARLWQLRIAERDMPLILSLFDEYVRRAG